MTISAASKDLHLISFASFIRFCSVTPIMVDKFEADTKIPRAGRSPLEKMIDKATGHDRKMAEDFIKWCAGEYGREYLPDDYLAQIMKPATP